MSNLANSLLKRTAATARYICPNAWWALPFSVLVIGLTARVVESRLDLLGDDNYWLMVGIDKPFLEYAQGPVPYGLPLLVHYWGSYRVFGSSLSGYLVLPLISSLAALLVVYFGIKKQWGHAAWGICFFTLAFLAFNGYSLWLARYAMFTYANELLVSSALFFLFLYLCSRRLTRKQWAWVAALFIPAAFFSNIYILVPVFVGAVSVIAVRYWHSHGRYRLNDLRLYVMEIWPLAIFPVVQFFALLLHPQGPFRPWSAARGGLTYTDPFFFSSSQYPQSLWGAIQFVSHNTVELFRGLLQTPYTSSFSSTLWTVIEIGMLILIFVLFIRMVQRKLEPGMSFVVTFTILVVAAMAVGGLLGLYPYGRQRYAVFLLLPIGLVIAYAASFILTRISGRFSVVPKWKAIPIALALIIIVAGTIRNVDTYHYNTSITDRNWAALHQIRDTNADLLLMSLFGEIVVRPVYPDLYASAYSMGTGKTGFLRWKDEEVPSEIAEAIQSGSGPETVSTILVIHPRKYGFDLYYPSWSALLNTYFDLTSEIQGPTIWGGYYTRKE